MSMRICPHCGRAITGFEHRNNEVLRLRERGATFPQLSKKFGVSIERIRQIYVKKARRAERERVRPYQDIPLEERSLDYLRLPVRARNVLTNHGCSYGLDCKTVGDVIKQVSTPEGQWDLFREPNCGSKTVADIVLAVNREIDDGVAIPLHPRLEQLRRRVRALAAGLREEMRR